MNLLHSRNDNVDPSAMLAELAQVLVDSGECANLTDAVEKLERAMTEPVQVSDP